MIRRLAFWATKRALREGVRSGTRSGMSSTVLGTRRSTAVGDATRLEVRPAITLSHQLTKATPVLGVVFMGAFVLRSGLVGLLVGAIVVAIAMSTMVSFRRRARVVITPTEIVREGVFGLRRSRPRSDVTTVLSAPLQGRSRAVHAIFVLDAEGRPIVRMKETVWALDDMKRVVRALDVPPTGPGKAVRPQTLAADYPHVLRWHERHPTAVRITTGGLFAAAVIAVVLTLL